MNKDSALYAFGAILLGIVGIVFQDFARQWQGVPDGIAMRMPLVYLSAALLLIGGGALLARRTERMGALLLAAFYGFWVIALHLPRALGSWKHIGAWNAPAEITYMAMGALALFAAGPGALRLRLSLMARLLAGVSALVFGLAHFNYIEFTAISCRRGFPRRRCSGPGPPGRAILPPGWHWSAASRRGSR